MALANFVKDWLEDKNFKDWVLPVTNNPSRAYCQLCRQLITADYSVLQTHAGTKKHKDLMESKLEDNETTQTHDIQVVIDGTAASHTYLESSNTHMTRVYKPRIKKYRLEWESMNELKGWIQSFPLDSTKAYCKFCDVPIRAHKSDLVLHSKSKKHLKWEEEFVREGPSREVTGNRLENRLRLSPGVNADFPQSDSPEDREVEETGTIHFGLVGESDMDSRPASNSSLSPTAKKDAGKVLFWKPTSPVNKLRCSPISTASSQNQYTQRSRRKRRLQLPEIIGAIERDEFTGYELLQIVKSAVPKL